MLAWAVIFAHSIIPHNHIDECNTFLCSSNPHSDRANSQSSNLKLTSQDEDLKACHISGLLFHQFSQDDLFSDAICKSGIVPLNPVSSYSFRSFNISLAEYQRSSVSFRAPPLA